MKPYALEAGEGWIRNYGIDHVIKVGELSPGRGAAIFEYTSVKGEKPLLHTHATEDEIFYVLEGEATFHCGGEDFLGRRGGTMVLPTGVRHGYTITGDTPLRLIAVTYPVRETEGNGWGGYVADVEREGELVAAPEV